MKNPLTKDQINKIIDRIIDKIGYLLPLSDRASDGSLDELNVLWQMADYIHYSREIIPGENGCTKGVYCCFSSRNQAVIRMVLLSTSESFAN